MPPLRVLVLLMWACAPCTVATRSSRLGGPVTRQAASTKPATNTTSATKNATSPAAVVKVGKEPIFQLLMREWKEVPDLGKFTEKCVAIISKLLPRLRYDYTSLNVPKVLLHDCDVYKTKTDWQTNNTNLESARLNCRYSARRLGDEFMGGKDYKGWCQDFHSYLSEEANRHVQLTEREKLLSEQEKMRQELEELRKQYQEMLKKKGQISNELDALGRELNNKDLPCCPANCRRC